MKPTSTLSERDSAADAPLEANLDEKEYCRITGESRATARRNRLLDKGCPYLKLGARVFYQPAHVRQYLAQNVRTPRRGNALVNDRVTRNA
jgi:hypothetical protein